MERLDRQLRENMQRQEENNAKKNKKRTVINNNAPTYDLYGNSGDTIVVKKEINYKKITMISIIIFGILLVLYLPQLLYKPVNNSGSFDTMPDSTAIKLASQYVKDCPDEDFDGDGLSNYKEIEYGCSPFIKDTDKDGVSDYAEITKYKTNPTKTNSTLLNYIRKKDQESGKSIDTPYKIGNVILWADSYNDKAYGGVIETFGGYRFTNFNGWAKFPTGKYAYKYENGKHELLKHRANEDAWRIEEDCVVLLYDKELEMSVSVGVLGKQFYIKSNFLTDIIAFVLPNDAGIFTACKIAKIDADINIDGGQTAMFKKPVYNIDELDRFGTAYDSLHVIVKVRECINNNQTIAVSLFSESKGENIGIVCGYTKDGRLMVYNENGDFLGYITIYEKAAYMLNEKEQLVVRQWFAFEGLGYSSSNWDRISFFGLSDSNLSDLNSDADNKDKITESEDDEKEPIENTGGNENEIDTSISGDEEITEKEEITDGETTNEDLDDFDDTQEMY